MNPLFSICIITKNEADKLKKCLHAARQLPAEIVVIDTGSDDHTQDVMKEYADVCGQFEWCDDFAKAKNYAVSQASCDWVLILDTDEYILTYNPDDITNLINHHPYATGCLLRRNHFIQDNEERITYTRTDRLYNRRFYTFQGRIHEQLVRTDTVPAATDADSAHTTTGTPVSGQQNTSAKADGSIDIHLTIDHDSYDNCTTGMEEKAKRNKRLLLMDLNEFGENPYTLYQLGKSCYTLHEYKDAAQYFSKGLEYDLDPELEYVVDMVETYGYALINAGQADVARGLESVYDTFCHRPGFVFLMGTIYMNLGMLNEAVEQFLLAVTLPEDEVEGANSYLAYYNTGVIYECAGYPEEARKYYRQCGNYPKALQRLEALK